MNRKIVITIIPLVILIVSCSEYPLFPYKEPLSDPLYLTEKGDKMLLNGNYQEAIVYYSEALTIDPLFTRSLKGRAKARSLLYFNIDRIIDKYTEYTKKNDTILNLYSPEYLGNYSSNEIKTIIDSILADLDLLLKIQDSTETYIYIDAAIFHILRALNILYEYNIKIEKRKDIYTLSGIDTLDISNKHLIPVFKEATKSLSYTENFARLHSSEIFIQISTLSENIKNLLEFYIAILGG